MGFLNFKVNILKGYKIISFLNNQMLPVVTMQKWSSDMPFSITVSELMVQSGSGVPVAVEKSHYFSIKCPKLLIKVVIKSDSSISFEFNVSQETISIQKFPLTVDKIFSAKVWAQVVLWGFTEKQHERDEGKGQSLKVDDH